LVVAQDRTQDHASCKADQQDAAAVIAHVAIAVGRGAQACVAIVDSPVVAFPAARQPVAPAPIAVVLVVVTAAFETTPVVIAAAMVTATIAVEEALRRSRARHRAGQDQRAQASHKNAFHVLAPQRSETNSSLVDAHNAPEVLNPRWNSRLAFTQ